MSTFKEFTKGFFRENPVFVIALGLCPTLATSSLVEKGLGMGMAATFVLVCSNVIIALIRKLVPSRIRIPIFIVVIAAFVVIVELAMKAYLPPLSESLGIFIPLIVVNCIILGRAEAYAQKNNVSRSFMDGLGMGLGFTFALLVIATIREVLGFGTFLGLPVFGSDFEPATIMILSPGGFITIGFLMGYFAWRRRRKKMKGVGDPDELLAERQRLTETTREAA
ncbi:MAG: electron transport complex subunit RsxE [Candidatus Coatesbacteria bacterium RBG_13_66_14]|uniref:Ion-translocating oxidoreductase complex subunit E n=1 Tax=Candidatus Coatesbacteria bacterium RBG_13_66_14 TaxID=1817816 RepID=A0A1F5F2L2_9BACT|nr:MAG: electron transport complex subunit RsxE [Candidatus Coatesbacteria bacterium RBG_13_66_14]